MRIAAVLRAIHVLPPAPPIDVDDQTYSEAVMENAVRQSDRDIERLNRAAERSAASTARLSAGVERLTMASVDPRDVMAELVKGMKSRGGVI